MRSRASSCAPALLALLAACSDPALTGAAGELAVAPARLDFPATHVGERATLFVELDNRGRAATSFQLAIEPPFTVIPAGDGALLGGERLALQVVFAPELLGDAGGTLLVRSESGTRELALTGTGLPRLDCPTPPECAWLHFDEAAGACVEEQLPDGTICGGICVRGGACLAGVCLGTAAACDDGDPCTSDACDPLEGCFHFEATCAPSDDPYACTVPRCDPARGCVADPVEDGTLCGPPTDCSTEHRCSAGACVEVQSTELQPCGEPTPCRTTGVCRRGLCEQPPRHPLVPLFRLTAGAGRTLLFDGVTDPAGNLFWAECTDRSCLAASATSNGFSRWRTELFRGDGSRPPAGHLALAGDRLVSTFAPDRVAALDARDGTTLWTAQLQRLLAPDLPAGIAFELEEVGAPVLQPDGAVALLVRAVPAGDPAADASPLGFLLVLDGADGTLRLRLREEGELSGLIGDERGNLYYSVLGTLDDAGERARLVSVRPDGVVRWRRRTPFQPPLGATSGALLQGTGDLRSTTNGRLRTDLRLSIPLWPAAPLLDGSDAWVIGFRGGEDGARSWAPKLLRYPVDDPAPAFAFELPGAEPWERSEPLLTSAGSALLVTTSPGPSCAEESFLQEISPDGLSLFTCELPRGGAYSGAISLTQGRFVIADGCSGALLGFELPGLDTAPRGWVTSGGEPGRSGRPR